MELQSREVGGHRVVDDLIEHQRQLRESFDYCFSAEGRIILEQYLQGRLVIGLDISAFGHRYRLAAACACLDDSGGLNNKLLSRIEGHALFDPVLSDLDDGNYEVVLVRNVEVVKSVECIIPTSVWFYPINDEVTDSRIGYFHFSAVDRAYKLIAMLPEGEFRVLALGCPHKADKLVVHEIKSAMQVVSRIPDDKRHVVWDLPPELRPEHIVAGLRVHIGDDRTEIGLAEGMDSRLEIVDVFFGPADL